MEQRIKVMGVDYLIPSSKIGDLISWLNGNAIIPEKETIREVITNQSENDNDNRHLILG